jgi:hypothetical protein
MAFGGITVADRGIMNAHARHLQIYMQIYMQMDAYSSSVVSLCNQVSHVAL